MARHWSLSRHRLWSARSLLGLLDRSCEMHVDGWAEAEMFCCPNFHLVSAQQYSSTYVADFIKPYGVRQAKQLPQAEVSNLEPPGRDTPRLTLCQSL